MGQDYGKRIEDMTVEQIESAVHKAIEDAVPADAIRNMPIAKIDEAHAAALKGLGFFPLPDVKCKLVCTVSYPPGKAECRLECSFSFLK